MKLKIIFSLFFFFTLSLCVAQENSNNLIYLNETSPEYQGVDHIKKDETLELDQYSNVHLVQSESFYNCFIDQKVIIHLPDGTVAEFMADRVDSKPNGDYYWSGVTATNQGSFIIHKDDETGYFGMIRADNGSKYDFFSLSSQVIGIFEIDPEITDPIQAICSPPENVFDPNEEHEDEEDQAIIRSCTGIPVIRVLFLYTNQANNSIWVPSTMALRTIETMNQSLEASEEGIAIFELAGTEPLPGFIETINISNDLNALTENNVANQLRDDHHADLVVLFTNKDYNGISGLAKAEPASEEDEAYAIVEINFAIFGGLTALHEIGHLMGAKHQRWSRCPRGNSSCCSKHRGFDIEGTNFKTMMHTLFCGKERILRWSNRHSLLNGRATGNKKNQNTRAFLKNSCDIADFRESPPDLNLYARINGPGAMYCCSSNAIWTAEIYNNPGNPPYTYIWEKSSNGIDNWCTLGINASTITASQLSFTGCGCGSSFFLRLTITDNSAPAKIASHQIGVEYVPCLTDGGDTREEAAVLQGIPNKIESSIHPNPVKDILYYESDQSAILAIFDLNGKKIGLNYQHKANHLTNVNTANLPKGTYLLVVKSDTNQFIQQHKFIKL